MSVIVQLKISCRSSSLLQAVVGWQFVSWRVNQVGVVIQKRIIIVMFMLFFNNDFQAKACWQFISGRVNQKPFRYQGKASSEFIVIIIQNN